MVEIVEFRPNHDCIDDLLEYCIGNPSKDKIQKILLAYAKEKEKYIYCYKKEKEILGFIGILDDKEHITINHIAVAIKSRGLGIGKKLIDYVFDKFLPESIIAETDDDAVNFYKKVGFEIQNLPEAYQGITRYKCKRGITESHQ